MFSCVQIPSQLAPKFCQRASGYGSVGRHEFYSSDGSIGSILAVNRRLSQGYIWQYEGWNNLGNSHLYSTDILVCQRCGVSGLIIFFLTW